MLLPFLSALLPNANAALVRGLQAQLVRLPLLAEISENTIRRLLPEEAWFCLPGGKRLKRDSDNEGALFLVLSGSLGVFAAENGGGHRQIAQLSPGEVLGEGGLLTHGPQLELAALRDSEILRLSPAGFELLASQHPRLMLAMIAGLAQRLTDPARDHRRRNEAKTFALVPMQEGLADEPLAERLAAALGQAGTKACVIDADAASQPAEWFATLEAAHTVILYRGDTPDSAWTQHCIRQADRILLLAHSGRPLPLKPMRGLKQQVCGLPELVLLHPGPARQRLHAPYGLRRDSFESLHHIRQGNDEDIRRLARCVSGRAVGLVLGGGGARGFAHIGMVKALSEAGVPFDYLGGVSMGAIIAAGLACEWSLEDLEQRMRAAFVKSHPLTDYTFPLIALVKGRKMTKLLSSSFGKTAIEEMARPYFCISSDLTTGHIHEHRIGPLWRALRASAALPGIVPPVTHHGHLLVDGGVMNNLPVDIMRKRRIGPLIACDVTGIIDFSVRDRNYGERPIWRMLWQKVAGMPSIFDILTRAGTLGSEAQRRLVRDEADLLIEPPLEGLGPLDWKSFDRAVAEGYAYTADQIDKHGLPFAGF